MSTKKIKNFESLFINWIELKNSKLNELTEVIYFNNNIRTIFLLIWPPLYVWLNMLHGMVAWCEMFAKVVIIFTNADIIENILVYERQRDIREWGRCSHIWWGVIDLVGTPYEYICKKRKRGWCKESHSRKTLPMIFSRRTHDARLRSSDNRTWSNDDHEHWLDTYIYL